MKRAIILILLLAAPLWAENDFSGDANCVALYNLEDGALTTDSSPGGAHTLTANYGVTSNVAPRQGSYSGQFVAAQEDFMERTHASGFTNFPGKTADMDLSFAGWFYTSSLPSSGAYLKLASVWGVTAADCAWAISLCNIGGTVQWYGEIGDGPGPGSADGLLLNPVNAIAAGRWYHVTFTHNHTTKETILRVWDETNAAVDTASETLSIGMAAVVSDTPFQLGRAYWGTTLDGYLDEVAIFNDVLTDDEIDEIRGGEYGASAVNMWWWRRRHSE